MDTRAKDGPIRNQLGAGVIAANSGDIGYCLTATAQQSLDAETETLIAVAHAVAPPVTHNPYGDHESRDGLLVAHALRGEGHDASEDGAGRRVPLVPVAIQERAICENPNAGPDGAGVRQDGAAYTIEARPVPQAVAFSFKDFGNDAADNLSPTLRSLGAYGANGGSQMAVAFAENSRAEIRLCGGDGAVSSQLTTGGGKPGQGLPAVAFDLRGRDGGAMPEGPHDTAALRAASGGSSRSYVAAPWVVRRLTPRECERLQGFPDDYTRIPGATKGTWRDLDLAAESVDDMRAAGLPVRQHPKRGVWQVRDPDGPRYKALGNSMAVNVMEWIGERIALVEGLK